MKEIAAKSGERTCLLYSAALYAIERGMPQRRTCALMQVVRSSFFYIRGLPFKNAPVVNAMQRLPQQYPRYGGRRIRVFLERKGIEIGSDRCRWLYRPSMACNAEETLQKACSGM